MTKCQFNKKIHCGYTGCWNGCCNFPKHQQTFGAPITKPPPIVTRKTMQAEARKKAKRTKEAYDKMHEHLHPKAEQKKKKHRQVVKVTEKHGVRSTFYKREKK